MDVDSELDTMYHSGLQPSVFSIYRIILDFLFIYLFTLRLVLSAEPIKLVQLFVKKIM